MENRPDPDKLLEQINAEESKRGKLKIFFGAVAGVGKTYAMLELARQRKKENIDVVIGIAETHKRPETGLLLEGFEIIPQKNISYRGITVREFDLQTALDRHPSLIIVDELAHTNAPGSRHVKRWQDVEELLDSGIDVYTTLNVQHCESVNDVVAQITQVIVRETVPDTFVEKADEIELIDIPTEELLKRLREGKVYVGDQAEYASQNFFRFGNLIALRKLALRYTTRSVDSKLRAFHDVNTISGVWKAGGHLLACISTNPRGIKIIRAAKQIASDLGNQWTVAHVDGPSAFEHKEKYKQQVVELLSYAEKMGADSVKLYGEDIAETLIAYAQSENISTIIIGKPGRKTLRERLFGSFIDSLTRKCGDIDLYLISGESEEEPLKTKYAASHSFPFSWKGVVSAFLIIGLCTLIDALLFKHLALANLIMVYLLGVVWLAYRYGWHISIIGSLLSVVCFDLFFIEPLYSFTVMDREHFITFGVMLVVGLLIGRLTGRLHRHTIELSMREEKTQVLYSLSRDLARSSRPDELFQILLSHISNFFKCPAVIFIPNQSGDALNVLTSVSGGRELVSMEHAVAGWVFEHHKIAGKGTDTFSGSQGLYMPLTGSHETVAVLGLVPGSEQKLLNPEVYHILEMFVMQTAMAVEGARLAEVRIKAESEILNYGLRNMILETAKYDYKNAIEAISKAASELADKKITDDVSKRDSLIQTIIKQAEELDNLASELPKIIDELKKK
jgi:two-component system, OmpR family, sensor histidine kinase KdpD